MPTFSNILQEFYTESPERISVTLQYTTQGDETFTYKELLDGANAYAQYYAEKGIERNEVIVLILQHGKDLLFAFWGAVEQCWVAAHLKGGSAPMVRGPVFWFSHFLTGSMRAAGRQGTCQAFSRRAAERV